MSEKLFGQYSDGTYAADGVKHRIKLFIARQVKYTLNLAEQLKIDL